MSSQVKTAVKGNKGKVTIETQDFSRNLYENTSPIGLKTSKSLPKVRFQKEISEKKGNNFKVFNRYLKYKFGEVQDSFEVPMLPVKRKSSNYVQWNLYDLMGLSPGCDQNTIKKMYRKLAGVHHPDKKGDPLFFRCLNQTYEILCNVDTKEIYDNDGFKGVKAITDMDTAELEAFILTHNAF